MLHVSIQSGCPTLKFPNKTPLHNLGRGKNNECPVLMVHVTHCFPGRCWKELLFFKDSVTMGSNINCKDVKSGLMLCCGRAFKRRENQLGRNGFGSFEPVEGVRTQLSEAFTQSVCWPCSWGSDVRSAYRSAPSLFQLSAWHTADRHRSCLAFSPAYWARGGLGAGLEAADVPLQKSGQMTGKGSCESMPSSYLLLRVSCSPKTHP